MAVAIIERGSIQEAFFSSSAKCTLESAPITSPIAALMPTREATPGLDQPLDENVVNTDESPFGAMTLAGQESANIRVLLRLCKPSRIARTRARQ